MPNYLPPVFSINCNIWHDGTSTADPPDLFTACQLYTNTRGLLDIQEDDDALWVPPVWLRLPFGTNVQRLDTVECPAGSSRWYHVRWVEFAHLGFPNQYTIALMAQLPGFVPPPPGSFFELEASADAILTEAGTNIDLE